MLLKTEVDLFDMPEHQNTELGMGKNFRVFRFSTLAIFTI